MEIQLTNILNIPDSLKVVKDNRLSFSSTYASDDNLRVVTGMTVENKLLIIFCNDLFYINLHNDRKQNKNN